MNIRKFFGDKAFYKMVLAIFIPLMLQQGVTNFVNLLDNIMVGQVGTEQMSGVAISNQLISILNLCIFGGMSGIGIFGAQYFGAGDMEGARRTFRLKLWLIVILLGIFFCLFLLKGRDLIALYLNDEGENVGDIAATLDYGEEYMRIMLIGLVPFSLVQVYASTLREAKFPVLPMVASIIAVFVNLIFNYLLIFGHLGLPEMGCAGAAIATVISRFVECLIIIIVAARSKERLPFQQGLYKTMKVPMKLTKRVAIISFPLLLNECLWSIGQATLLQCYSQRGLAAVAALNISNTVSHLFFIFFFASGNAIGIIVGQMLGAGKIEEARDTDRKLIAFSVLGSTAMAILLASVSRLIPQIYNTQPYVRELASKMMLVVALCMPIGALNHSSYFTIRCGGKTWLTFLFDSAYTWVVTIALVWSLVTFTDLPVIHVYFLVSISDIIKSTFGVILVAQGKWAKNVIHEKKAEPLKDAE